MAADTDAVLSAGWHLLEPGASNVARIFKRLMPEL